MAPDSDAGPPGDALPLLEALWRYGDPQKIKAYLGAAADADETSGDSLFVQMRDEAWEDLVNSFLPGLRAGQLDSWAREGSPLRDYGRVPSDSWLSLSVLNWPQAIVGDPTTSYRLYCVRVGRAAPTEARDNLVATRLPAESETATRDWLVNLMRSGPPRTKEWCLGEAKRLFGVSSRGFIQAWGAAITATGATEWQKPGRKKS